MSGRTRKVLREMIRGIEEALAEVPAYEDLGFILMVADPLDGSFSAAHTPDLNELECKAMLRELAANLNSKRRMDA